MAMNPALQTTGKDRRMYVWFAVFMPIIVLAGFARSYYLKGFFGFPALPSLLVHLHGIVMTSCVVLFVTQVTLVATGRTRMHQRLALVRAVRAPQVIVVGVLTAIA